MNNLIVRRPWTRQPPTGVALSATGINSNLSALFDCRSAFELVKRKPASNRTSLIVSSKAGVAADFSSSANQQYAHDSNYAIVGPITIAAFVEVDALTNFGAIIAKQQTTTANVPYELRIGSSSTDGKLSFIRAAANAERFQREASTSIVSATQSPTLIVVRNDGNLASIPDAFVNGVKTALSGGFANYISASIGDSGSSNVWIGRRFDGATQLDGRIYYVALWSRQLTDTEIISLSINPWQVFGRQQIIIPYAAAGATSPTLGTASAINITATGATPQLTATW